ncbi:MAG: hypothetical protein ACFHU9_07115 [Fluviicola sp.]
MSSSVKFISPTNSKKSVFITYETDWKNAKFYVDGKLVATVSEPKELKKGIHLEIEGLGKMDFQVNLTALSPNLTVNGEKFVKEKRMREPVDGTNSIIVFFSILSFMNLLLFLLSLVRLFESEMAYMEDFSRRVVFLSGFFMALYLTCAILIAREKYFMYFVGTLSFLITTVLIISTIVQETEPVVYLIVVPRIIVLILLFAFFKKMLNHIRASDDDVDSDILDEQF